MTGALCCWSQCIRGLEAESICSSCLSHVLLSFQLRKLADRMLPIGKVGLLLSLTLDNHSRHSRRLVS